MYSKSLTACAIRPTIKRRSPTGTLISESLGAAVYEAFRYIRAQGIDPEKIMLEKHEYNKTRPYRHGGKKC